MNTRLLILTLIIVLGLVGPLEASHLQQQSLALQQQGLTLAQTYRQLMVQKRGILDQLSKLKSKTNAEPKDWNALFMVYHQIALDTANHNLDQLTSDQNNYQNQLHNLTPKHVDAQAFQNQVTALFTALEAVQQQLDANAQAWVAYKQQVQLLNAAKNAHNQK